MSHARSSHVGRLLLAFAAVYLIWGSTFLAIRFAVETIPPLLMMCGRCLGAGLILYAGARLSGTPPPEPRQWLPAIVSGGLLSPCAMAFSRGPSSASRRAPRR